MLTRILLVLAACGLLFASFMAVRGARDVQAAAPVAPPAEAPYPRFVAGAALIEPAGENISIVAPVPGLAVEVAVKSGDFVKAGDLLFRIDDRAAKAAVASAEAAAAVAQAAVAVADAEVARLEAGNRPEEIAIRRAAVAVAEAQAADLKDLQATMTAVSDQRAVSRMELDRRRFAVATAEAGLAKAKAECALWDAGTWDKDLAIARAKQASAKASAAFARAQADAARVDLARLSVTAPGDARVLRVNLRAGEYAPVQPFGGTSSLMVLGDTRVLHVRADIDENDAWRVQSGARAQAFARGNRDLGVELKFVRIEPLIIPKKSLTGDSTERVDTRVLQAVFAFEPKNMPLYVGQQMDVYIEVK